MRIIQGDILSFKGDAIVNPANSFLRHGGGLARVIEAAATDDVSKGMLADYGVLGPVRQWYADHADAPLIPTGSAHVTSAGVLPFKGVVHAVGPIWGGGHFHERSLLQSAHVEACAAAWDKGWRSLAFPAISCGVFGYPVEKAAKAAINALSEFWAAPQPRGVEMDISFYLFEGAHRLAYTKAAIAAGVSVDNDPLI